MELSQTQLEEELSSWIPIVIKYALGDKVKGKVTSE
jgi:hypothetical protein